MREGAKAAAGAKIFLSLLCHFVNGLFASPISDGYPAGGAPFSHTRGHFSGQKTIYCGQFQQEFLAKRKIGVFEAGIAGFTAQLSFLPASRKGKRGHGRVAAVVFSQCGAAAGTATLRGNRQRLAS